MYKTVESIHALAIKMGIAADFRQKDEIEADLKRRRERFEKLSDVEKSFFDEELFTNPYADTRILFDSGKEVKRVLAGIDIEVAEVLLADRLGNIDLLIAHHPEGKALAMLDDVMHLQADVLAQYGVPINVAEGLLQLRISEVSRGLSPVNHERAVDAAQKFGISFMTAHTATDNLAANF